MTNHMEEVAKMFGLELGEAFRIIDDTDDYYLGYYRLSKEHGVETSCDNILWDGFNEKVLHWLMLGEVKIEKLPWKPKEYELYYYPRPDIDNLYDSSSWDNHRIDQHRFKHDMVFKTKEEAVALAKEMLAMAEKERLQKQEGDVE